MTIFFRKLAAFKKDASVDGWNLIEDALYDLENTSEAVKTQWKQWFEAYAARLQQDQQNDEARNKRMNATNPKYVLRNYMAQLAIDAAEKGDFSLIDELYQVLKKPYDNQPEYEKWFAKRPEWARDKVGCSMLSCSS